MKANSFRAAYAAARRGFHAGTDEYGQAMDDISANGTRGQWRIAAWASENGWPPYATANRYAGLWRTVDDDEAIADSQ